MSQVKRKCGGTNCCLPQCNSTTNMGFCLYKVPSGERKRFAVSTAQWAKQFHQILFSYRGERMFKKKVFAGKAYICQKHFTPDDIRQTLTKSYLKHGVLPTLHLPKKYVPSKAMKKRRNIIKHVPTEPTEVSVQEKVYEERQLSVEKIIREFQANLKSSKWRMYELGQKKVHFTFYKEDDNHNMPDVSLLMKETEDNDIFYSCAVQGQYAALLASDIASMECPFLKVLEFLELKSVCCGYDIVLNSSEWLQSSCCTRSPLEDAIKIRYTSKKCQVIVSEQSQVCDECMKLHVKQNETFKRQQRRLCVVQNVPLPKFSPISTANPKRVHATISAHRERIMELERAFFSKGMEVSDSIAGILQHVKDSANAEDQNFLKEWWSVQHKLQSSDSKYSHRYPPSVIRYCLKLYAKSPAAYNMMQKVLTLPSPRMLRGERHKSGGNTSGLQASVISRISSAVARSQKECDRKAVLAFDEMTITEDIAFCSATGQIIGYVDFGDETLTSLSKSCDDVASHMLAFFLRGITNNNLDGVVAYYPTKNLDYAELMTVLADLLVNIQLQTSCTICGIVFDGLASNRTVMKMLASSVDDAIPYRMRNPVDVSRWIYFVPDPPHTLKTCRNNLFNPKKNLWNDGDIYMQPIHDIVREDFARGELRVYHKLTEAHVNPTSWEKMNVAIAAQTMSMTVGMALKQRGYTALAEFVLHIDKWFDCMNGGFQSKSFKRSRMVYHELTDSRLTWLEQDFVAYLQNWRASAEARPLVGEVNREKMLLSKASEDALLVSSLSLPAIIRETLAAGAEYVLARRINQDPLERYFGHQRQRVARNSAPTVRMFSSTANTLDIVKHSSVKGSNVESEH